MNQAIKDSEYKVKTCTDYTRAARALGYGFDDLTYPKYVEYIEEFGARKVTRAGFITALYTTFTREALNETLYNLQKEDQNNYAEKHLAQTIRQNQLVKDQKNLANKVLREENRAINSIQQTLEQILELQSTYKASQRPAKKAAKNAKAVKGKNYKVGILCLGDPHWRETVKLQDDIDNVYNYDISCKRLKLGIDTACDNLLSKNITDVVFLLGGDLINSNRRADEQLHQESTRGVATLVAVELLSQAIDDLSKHFNVKVAYVSGNESRFDFDNNFSMLSNTDNFDFLIYHILRNRYIKSKRVTFPDFGADPKQRYIDISGFKLLVVHGEGMTKRHIDKTLVRCAHEGKKVDCIVSFHYHSTELSDTHYRVGSLCGANTYSAKALQFYSRASMGVILVDDTGGWDAVKIDVQNVDNYAESYEIDSTLKEYFI